MRTVLKILAITAVTANQLWMGSEDMTIETTDFAEELDDTTDMVASAGDCPLEYDYNQMIKWHKEKLGGSYWLAGGECNYINKSLYVTDKHGRKGQLTLNIADPKLLHWAREDKARGGAWHFKYQME